MSNKKTIAVLQRQEMNDLENLSTSVATYRALLFNQFIEESEKILVNKKLHQLESDLDKKYVEVFNQYDIPMSVRDVASISFETGELYLSANGE